MYWFRVKTVFNSFNSCSFDKHEAKNYKNILNKNVFGDIHHLTFHFKCNVDFLILHFEHKLVGY